MKLSIILITWNSGQYVSRCLNSIAGSHISYEYEIILVDNGSSDDTLDIANGLLHGMSLSLKAGDGNIHGPGNIKTIRNAANKGVAAARNQGIKASIGEYMLLLDIDTAVYNSAIDRLITAMDENPDTGICAPRLFYPDGAVQHNCRRFPVIQTKFFRRCNIFGLFDKYVECEYYRHDRYTDMCNSASSISSGSCEMNRTRPFDVDYAIGACHMLRRSALDRIGLLDEKIFYGPEDVDICLRMWEKGWKVMCVPDAAVMHHEQRATKGRPFTGLWFKHLTGIFYFFHKHKYLFSRNRLYRKTGRMPG